ncbi:26 kDa periplasmic immunogenic protein [Roseibium sp. TrichSKD4]|uniref:SIMPL domain-containing protein n=1 Tax=Roseibium sp. TrichSKD4 TaxID=744980 RepID=UPI0001E569E4|nr:SIMPL domain-containing protein [Roseibium sp. TrichSKD4]EFO31858.1 26 kDa periplasmic immunogenic protein [Roseibium sp. TrichSKD4]
MKSLAISNQSLVSLSPTALLKRNALPVIVALGLSLAAFAPSLAKAEEHIVPHITISGEGKISVAPDMAVITTQVVSPGDTAPEALSANSKAMKAVIDEIKSAGIEAKDIKTSGFSIYPRYDHSKRAQNKAPKIVGYDVRNGVTVNVRDLDRLGDLLSTVVESGANQIGGISFQVSDPESKMDEARKKAVENARKKAEIYAEAAGSRLGEVLQISENGSYTPAPRGLRMEAMAMAADSVPVEAGENTLQASVTIKWELIED